MCIVSQYPFKSSLSWLGCLLVVSVLIGLGLWQLERADEKKSLMQLSESRRQEAPIRLDGEIQALDRLLFRRVLVSGSYDFKHQFLLDNQVVDGRIGAYVLTPLKINGSGRAVLVNRGWVPMVDRRVVNSSLDIPEPAVSIEGFIKPFPGVGFRLKGAEVPSGGWPGLIQLVDAEHLSRVLGYPLLPFQILLNPDFEPGYLRKWKMVYPVSPEKHVMYAVQWFALAVALIAIVRSISKRDGRHD